MNVRKCRKLHLVGGSPRQDRIAIAEHKEMARVCTLTYSISLTHCRIGSQRLASIFLERAVVSPTLELDLP